MQHTAKHFTNVQSIQTFPNTLRSITITHLHLNTDPMSIIRITTLSSFIVDPDPVIGFRGTEIHARSFRSIFNHPPAGFAGIVAVISIVQNTLHIQDPGMIIKSQVKTGNVCVTIVSSTHAVPEQICPMVPSIRFKAPAALTGHIQAHTHFCRTTIKDIDTIKHQPFRVPTKASI